MERINIQWKKWDNIVPKHGNSVCIVKRKIENEILLGYLRNVIGSLPGSVGQ
jgi:hypothetical protein